MQSLTHHEISFFFLAIAILLGTARLFGELARRFKQPTVLGEILAGILLGPTFFGRLAPHLFNEIFPRTGGLAISLNSLMTLAASLFLLVAGMELDLGSVFRQGRMAARVSIGGLVVPFFLGFVSAHYFPNLLGQPAEAEPFLFSLFFATALAISALPVIAKTLMDLNLYRSDLGVVIMAAAVFDDLSGWLVFAVILGFLSHGETSRFSVPETIGLTLGFAAFMLTIGKSLIHRFLPWLQAHASWPGGVLGFALSLTLLGCAFTEWIGIHAIFGAFIVGVAIGDSRHLREHTRITIEQFVSFIFAPLFFAGIGLRVDFLRHFDPLLCLVVLTIACLGKILGCWWGAHLARLPTREGLALAFGMNARGAMEIILGLLALEYHLISERVFVALVVMALVTSMMSGPLMQRVLQRKKARRFLAALSNKTFFLNLTARHREAGIREMSEQVARETSLSAEAITLAVMEREYLSSTGMGKGIAIPHARFNELDKPLIAVGLSTEGIDFDAPDGKPAHLLFLILTPNEDDGAQLEFLADIVKTYRNPGLIDKTLEVKSYTEFLGLMKSEGGQA